MSGEVLCGDMRELVSTISPEEVDMVLTDPPYNIGFSGYDIWGDRLPDDEYIEMLSLLQAFRRVVVIHYPEEMMRWVVPALGPPDHVGAWCYNSNMPRRLRLIAYYGVVPDYSRMRQPYKNPTDKRVRQMLWEGRGQGSPLYEWWDDIQLVKNVSREKDHIPCPVPIRLMDRIIQLTTEPGELVLDPFCGKGTTLIAAQQSGRRYIGIEVSPNYAREASEELSRLAALPTQIPLLTEETEQPRVVQGLLVPQEEVQR